jgi:hypothetical protein
VSGCGTVLCRSVVGLQALDFCECASGRASRNPTPILLLSVKDRKLGGTLPTRRIAARNAAVRNYELPRQVVERRAQLLQGVPEDERNDGRWRLRHIDSEQVARRIQVRMGRQDIGLALQVDPDFLVRLWCSENRTNVYSISRIAGVRSEAAS